MYEDELRELGLTENESLVYMTLLRSGALNPTELSKKTGLHRAYVYDTLERLLERGIVSSILVRNKRSFQAANPERLVELLKIKLDRLETIVPDMNKMFQANKEETYIEIHKGREILRTIIKDVLHLLKSGNTVLGIGIDEDKFSLVEPTFLKRYFAMIKRDKIKERIIIKSGGKMVPGSSVVYKFLDEKYIGNTAMLIYADKIVFIVFGDPNYGIMIENKAVAETYKRQFELLWSIAKK